jgi:hypothetical protein
VWLASDRFLPIVYVPGKKKEYNLLHAFAHPERENGLFLKMLVPRRIAVTNTLQATVYHLAIRKQERGA